MHHQRRKSGHGSGNSSTTDVRKANSSRPAPMTRRTTPQTAQKLGKSPKDREREWEEERWWDEERESFPQYCMICEKQFLPSGELFVYCSDACRIHDQTADGGAPPTPSHHSRSHAAASYPFYSGVPEPRDIIPRASPSRPGSMAYSPPSISHTSAIAALQSLSIRPPSPPSPIGTYQTSMWPSTRSAATSPSSSYTRPVSGMFPSTYDGVYYGAGTASAYGTSSDRPLPSRRPGIYSRPKSIELVTPMMGR
ncbi:hypothetical protein B0T26DRAFT_644033 [Lasiosphaeria miniovina]|uniref:Life-span regulatory factor domain-containing protein n=1 Tax=Lasiosphaeria miniovina TaxID=1954250 RepID=A0AA40AUX1_9PEZI|nr:uncharacterized protein B0T26DRAFT_644033 [Lasiosphaeria miniovina]KAK0722458.1 hypothetical protein B0T26DRAFT_644033 [Lasiosphaeria miniovina]